MADCHRKGLDVMKKKQMLATLVMLSLLQGSVYAAEVNTGTYNDFYEYSGEGTKQTQIKYAGEYTFVNGASIINTDLENDDGAQAIIHHSGIMKIILIKLQLMSEMIKIIHYLF